MRSIFWLSVLGQLPAVVLCGSTPTGCKALKSDDEWPAQAVWEDEVPGVIVNNVSDISDPSPSPDYRIRATKTCDVENAIKFAAKYNIRLAVITTGHDQESRSDAGSGLLIDLSLLRGVRVSESYTATTEGVENVAFDTEPNVITPIPGLQAAVTFGPAMVGSILQAAIAPSNLFTTSGAAHTVSLAGGWGQNGGYGPLTAQYGLGVDQWLEAKIVTPDGQLKVANAVSNPDLFWAIRGGGGGTFGVVIEATWKVYPTVPITTLNWYLNTTRTNTTFDKETGHGPISEAMAYFLGQLPALKEKGVTTFGYVGATQVRGFAIHPNISDQAVVRSIWEPILEKMQSFTGMTQYQTRAPVTSQNYSSFFVDSYGPLGINGDTFPTSYQPYDRGIFSYDSILLDKEHLANPNLTYALGGTGGAYGILGVSPGLAAGDGNDTSACPSWRKSVIHFVGYKEPSLGLSIDRLRQLAPEQGAYINEASVSQQNFTWAFWGDNYPRLSAIKTAIDPETLFWVSPGVNADHMEVVDGRVCKVKFISSPPAYTAPKMERHGPVNRSIDGMFSFGLTEFEGSQYPAPGTNIGFQ